jgi:hypothetical protein
MADEVSELKEEYNVARWFRASVREYPWGCYRCGANRVSDLPAAGETEGGLFLGRSR